MADWLNWLIGGSPKNDEVYVTHWLNRQMKKHGLSEAEALSTFHHSRVKKIGKYMGVSTKAFPGRHIFVKWLQKKDGSYLLTSCWKMPRYR